MRLRYAEEAAENVGYVKTMLGFELAIIFLPPFPFSSHLLYFSIYFASYKVLRISGKVFAKCPETTKSQFKCIENKTTANFCLICEYICRDVTSDPLILLHVPELCWKKTGGWLVPQLIIVQSCCDIICRHIRRTLYLYGTTLTHTLWILWEEAIWPGESSIFRNCN